MTRSIRMHRLLLAPTLAAVAAWPFAQAAHAGPPEPEVPTAIAVPSGHKLFLVAHAVGVQIYSCNATEGGHGWALLAPRASLYDDNGKLVATHFGGPTWQARDGSRVVHRRLRLLEGDRQLTPGEEH